MSDQYDVENALAALIGTVLYPNGTAVPSAVGFPIKIYPGWPNASTLDTDIAAGVAHVTVFDTNTERNTTRYPRDWHTASVNTAAVTLSVAGQTVTVGGAVPAPYFVHNLALFVNGQPYVYQLQPGDTLATAAAALRALVPGAGGTGLAITLSDTAVVGPARVGVTGQSIREVKRQERVYRITIWANTPQNRSALAKVIDPELAARDFLLMPDGFMARLRYRGSIQTDGLQKALLYKLDLNYSVEYATTQIRTDTQIVAVQTNTSLKNDGATQYGAVTTTYE